MNVMILVVLGIFALAVIVGIVLVLVFGVKSKPTEPILDVNRFLAALNPQNVTDISYRLNKIVVTLGDVEWFVAEDLQQAGAKGITIVGNKVKFYVDGSVEFNEMLYKELKQHIEGETK